MNQLEVLYTPRYEFAVNEGQASIERLVNAESIRALTEAFNVELPRFYGAYDDTRKLTWLKGFVNTYIDTRKGKERQAVTDTIYSPQQEAAIAAFTREFAMEGETDASEKEYGFISILGGANQSNLLRVRHAKRQMEELGVSAQYLLLLGSARPLDEKERAATANYAPGAATEYDLMNGAIETEFGIKASDEATFGPDGLPIDPESPDAGRVSYYELPNGTKVLSVSAPRIEGKDRANTADTYHFIAAILGEERFRQGKSILAVTTDLYVPFQHADAIRLLALPKGLTVETIGYGGVDRPAQSYANEINSAVNQAYTLNEELVKLADYKRLIQRPEVGAAVGKMHNSPERSLMVGKILLYISLGVMRRQAELDAVMAKFQDGRGLTVPELNDWIYWETQGDLEHSKPVVGDPEHFSPHSFAAVRGVSVKK